MSLKRLEDAAGGYLILELEVPGGTQNDYYCFVGELTDNPFDLNRKCINLKGKAYEAHYTEENKEQNLGSKNIKIYTCSPFSLDQIVEGNFRREETYLILRRAEVKFSSFFIIYLKK
ncbi:MAG: hypothetical protein ABIB79_02590 [archaeon]